MTEVWQVWCEWDIDQERLVFSSKEGAEKWARQAVLECNVLYADIDDSYEDFLKDGLIGLTKLKVIE